MTVALLREVRKAPSLDDQTCAIERMVRARDLIIDRAVEIPSCPIAESRARLRELLLDLTDEDWLVVSDPCILGDSPQRALRKIAWLVEASVTVALARCDLILPKVEYADREAVADTLRAAAFLHDTGLKVGFPGRSTDACTVRRKVGRPPGTSRLAPMADRIYALMHSGISKRQVALELDVPRSTLAGFLRYKGW